MILGNISKKADTKRVYINPLNKNLINIKLEINVVNNLAEIANVNRTNNIINGWKKNFLNESLRSFVFIQI